jgi:tetratricopeptide (TPR) repeat protein
LDYIDLILNYTLDMTTQVNTADRFSIEAKMNLGDRGRAELRQQIDDYYIEGLEAYAQGDLQRAIEYWNAALDLDPTFQPATENLIVARRALRLQQDMEALNKVE